jgi:hypothetical protein
MITTEPRISAHPQELTWRGFAIAEPTAVVPLGMCSFPRILPACQDGTPREPQVEPSADVARTARCRRWAWAPSVENSPLAKPPRRDGRSSHRPLSPDCSPVSAWHGLLRSKFARLPRRHAPRAAGRAVGRCRPDCSLLPLGMGSFARISPAHPSQGPTSRTGLLSKFFLPRTKKHLTP